MIDYKFYSVDQKGQATNRNLITGLVPSDRLIQDIREAYDYQGAVIYVDSNIFSSSAIEKQIFEQRTDNSLITKLLVDHSYETGLSEIDYNKKIAQVVKLGIEAKNILFVLNRSAYAEWMDKHISQIVFIDLFAVSAAVRHAIEKMPASQTNIEERPKKINLLVGKVDKQSRSLILESFFNSNLKDSTMFSILGMPKDVSNHSKEFLNFLKENQGPLDDVETFNQTDGVSSQGWTNNTQVYDDTSVSFICETHETNDSLFITEKTYRPILNRHPFVARASFPLLEYLKAIGFKTFEKFIDESYDQSRDINKEHSDVLVKRAGELLDQVKKNPTEIQEIVDHNYETLIKFAQSELANLNYRIFSAL